MSPDIDQWVNFILDDYLALADDSCVAILPHALRSFVELGIPEILAAGPVGLDELARAASGSPDHIQRLLRALASVGIVVSAGQGGFALTSVGRRLLVGTGDARESMAHTDSYHSWRHGTAAVRRGGPVFDDAHRDGFFEHKDAVSAANQSFATRMSERFHRCYRAMPGLPGWTGADTILDIGCAGGQLLGEILTVAPHADGIFFDRPAMIDLLRDSGLMERWPGRCAAVAGDFFDGLPSGADVHLMASVLHDWRDDEVETILKNSRTSLAEGGRLLIVEMAVTEGDEWHPSKWSDLGMMVLTGGRERTIAEFRRLLAACDYELTKTTHIPDSFFTLFEAR